MFKPNKNQILAGIAVLVIIVTGVLISVNSGMSSNNILSFLHIGMSQDAIAKKSVDYLNKSVLQQGTTAELVSSSKESGVIKMKIKVTTPTGSNTYDSYATLDGKLLFPEAFTIAPTATASNQDNQTAQNTTPAGPSDVKKVAQTMLDAYVVSNCPYGIQIQRALSNAIKSIPSLAQYVTVRYIGAVSGNTITSMHGNDEAQENLRQICIRQEQPAKYWDYVSCYIKKATGTASNGMPFGDSKSCQTETGVDSAQLNACVADSSRGLTYAKADFALDTKFNIQGSPTLVLNGEKISEDSFGGRSADAMRNIVCSSSITEPAFCSTKLDTTPATTSFSLSYAGSGGATAAANTNCAPTTN